MSVVFRAPDLFSVVCLSSSCVSDLFLFGLAAATPVAAMTSVVFLLPTTRGVVLCGGRRFGSAAGHVVFALGKRIRWQQNSMCSKRRNRSGRLANPSVAVVVLT